LPQTEIDFLVDRPFAPLLDQNPTIRKVHVYDRQSVLNTWRKIRAEGYDWIIDFQSSPRSILVGLCSGAAIRAGYRVTFWGKLFNRAMKRPGGNLSATEGKMNLIRTLLPNVPAAGDRRLFLSDDERRWAHAQMGDLPDSKKPIGLIPTHRRSSRRWPASHFIELGRLIATEGHPVWLFWGPGEEEYVADIERQVLGSRRIPKTSLRQMAALLERCKIIVTNDNGPMHLAVAVGIPTVTMYGPTDPTAWNPGGPLHRVVQASDVPCLGCNLNGCPFSHECMTHITPNAVFALCRS